MSVYFSTTNKSTGLYYYYYLLILDSINNKASWVVKSGEKTDMGTPIPIEPPTIDDSKYYCVYIKKWFPDPPVEKCTGESLKDVCCIYGLYLNMFITGGYQCKGYPDICAGVYTGPKSIETLTGPYDTSGECNDNCPDIW